MSVEARELTSETWTRWQGHVVNGVFPLGRYLGSSDHSGVFLTTSAARRSSEVAIKLIPANRVIAETLLPRWKRAGGFAESRLLHLLEWGGCQLDGLPYLYVVMEYADQTLAQLLLHRALTDEEAREMLPPILEALAFLHGRDLVQGQLKPANILVVGDQLKLASDTIRRVSEDSPSRGTPTVYDPPEAVHGRSSPAGDIWALGISLFEALTRRAPSGVGERRDAIVLPADFSSTFRDVVARCLSLRSQDRPTVRELVAWAQGSSRVSAAVPTIQPSALAPPGPKALDSASVRTEPPRTAAPEAVRPAPERPVRERPAPEAPQSSKHRELLGVMLAVAILALGWAGVHALRVHRSSVAPEPAAQPSTESLPRIPAAAASSTALLRTPVPVAPSRESGGNAIATSSAPLHQVIPDVPWSARRTIHGHIKVWVRVIVSQDGSVFAALVDRAGPSRYFRRLAIEAAKNWTFSPVDTPSRRLMQIRFEFSRDGTTGRAVALR